MQPDVRYNSPNDAVMRLHESIVRYNDQYWYCYIHNLNAILTPLAEYPTVALGHSSPNKLTISVNDEKLDIRSISIGYVNFPERTLYITRPPYRKQKQGTSTHNCLAIEVGKMAHVSLSDSMLYSEHTINTLHQTMPSIKVCWLSLYQNQRNAQAFHPSFCLQKIGAEIFVYFEQDRIGTVGGKSSPSITLFPNKLDSILIMKLNALGIKVNNG